LEEITPDLNQFREDLGPKVTVEHSDQTSQSRAVGEYSTGLQANSKFPHSSLECRGQLEPYLLSGTAGSTAPNPFSGVQRFLLPTKMAEVDPPQKVAAELLQDSVPQHGGDRRIVVREANPPFRALQHLD
jgi:hypothetical protein